MNWSRVARTIFCIAVGIPIGLAVLYVWMLVSYLRKGGLP